MRRAVGFRTQSQSNDLAATRRHIETVMGGRFRARLVLDSRPPVSLDHVIVKCVFHIWRRIRLPPEPADVGFIFREQEVGIPFAMKRALAKRAV